MPPAIWAMTTLRAALVGLVAGLAMKLLIHFWQASQLAGNAAVVAFSIAIVGLLAGLVVRRWQSVAGAYWLFVAAWSVAAYFCLRVWP